MFTPSDDQKMLTEFIYTVIRAARFAHVDIDRETDRAISHIVADRLLESGILKDLLKINAEPADN